MDPLSDVFSLLKVQSVLSARLEAAGPWAMRFPGYQHLKFGGVIEGARWLWIEGVLAPVKMEAGDFYLLSNGLPYCFASDPAAPLLDGSRTFAEHLCEDGIIRYGTGGLRTVGAGGRFTFDDDLSGLLLDLLPPLIHIRGDSPQARSLGAALALIGFETEAARPGAAAMAGSLANIVLVNILRAYLDSETRPVGWLGALADARTGRALHLMHGDVARRWKVEDLAAAVGMSRTSFAERFRVLVGLPPLEYLIRWRMAKARSALKEGRDTLAVIAERIGYESETAFSQAFKRLFGESPGRYRIQARGTAPDRMVPVEVDPA
ncbi:MAG: transcriptional regulator, AraC family [Nevskia sp.]|nr:transcriptional regulator, AraC family [Nevskia sp.]